METLLDRALEDVVNTDGVTGSVVSDKHGLCLGNIWFCGVNNLLDCHVQKLSHPTTPSATYRPSYYTYAPFFAISMTSMYHVFPQVTPCQGIASPESSGLITAISEYARKLHPNEPGPTVVLENSEKQCIIKSNDKLVVSVYKSLGTDHYPGSQ